MDQPLYLSMVTLREQIKLLHFQTINYSVHKITDDFLKTYDELFDTFWEAKQSSKFRVIIEGTPTIKMVNVRSFEQLNPELTHVESLLSREDTPAVIPSRDALLESIAKFRYLITFDG